MTKEEFIIRRCQIVSKMLDNPDPHGIYPTTRAYAELDDLYDQLVEGEQEPSGAQELRNQSRQSGAV